MAIYTLANLQTDIRGYTEVGDTVLTDAVLKNIIKNSENAILRSVPTDQNAHYATSNLVVDNRYVTIPSDLKIYKLCTTYRFTRKTVFFRTKRS